MIDWFEASSIVYDNISQGAGAIVSVMEPSSNKHRVYIQLKWLTITISITKYVHIHIWSCRACMYVYSAKQGRKVVPTGLSINYKSNQTITCRDVYTAD